MLLNTIIYSTCKYHGVEEINYYIIDYGSETLRRFIGLPHVGGIVFQGEEEKYNNLLKLLKEELTRRKSLFVDSGGSYLNYIKTSENKLPVISVIINNFDSLYGSNPNLYEEISDLIRDSVNYGVVFIITANAVNSISSRLTANFTNVYAFKLKDTSDYSSVLGLRVKTMPRDIIGRGYLKNDGIHEFQTASITEDVATLNDYLVDFIAKEKEKSVIKAKRIPTLPDIIRYNDILEEVSNLKNVPIGISKKDLEIVTVDFLASPGNIITANRISSCLNFIKSLLTVIGSTKNSTLMVIDVTKALNLNTNEYPNYYTENISDILGKITEYLQKLIDAKSENEGIILIYGLNKFVSKVNDNNKILEFIKKIKEYEKISVIVVDDAAKIKQYAFESWFTGTFSTNDGIFIGRGVSDQNLIRLSTITKEMSKDIKNNMAYYITEGYATLLKVIDFVSKEEEQDEK